MNWKWAILLILICSCKGGNKKESQNEETEATPIAIEGAEKEGSSHINFPLDFPVSSLSQMVNDELPPTLIDETIPLKKKGDSLKLVIRPLGKMLFNAYGNNLDVSLPMEVSAQLQMKVIGIKVKNKEPITFDIRADLHTRLAINGDWTLSPSCTVQKVHWITPPKTKIAGIKVNLEKQVNKIMEKNYGSIEAAVCKSLSNMVPIREQVTKVWDALNEPHQISRSPVPIWLTASPSGISADFDKKILDTLRVNISCHSELLISPLAGVKTTSKPLPENRKSGADSGGLDLKVKLLVPYQQLNSILQDKVGSEKIAYQGYSISLDNFRSQTANNQLEISMDIVGDLSAAVDAFTSPTLTSENVLRFEKINVEVESENTLVNMASWIAGSSLNQLLSEKAVIPLQHVMSSLDGKIMNALNKSSLGNKIQLKLHFDKIASDTLSYYEDRFEWTIDVDGQLHGYLTDHLLD